MWRSPDRAALGQRPSSGTELQLALTRPEGSEWSRPPDLRDTRGMAWPDRHNRYHR